jgi:hypothetical protein
MAAWAYACHPCGGEPATWYVPQATVDEMPRDVRVVRVQVGSEWLCAVVDRSRRVNVEGLLLREVIASNAADCPECAQALSAAEAGRGGQRVASAAEGADESATAATQPASAVQAAAISLAGIRLAVVAVSRDLVRSPGEADMAIDDLRPRFGGVPVVLMAQNDEGAPIYYGDRELVELLAEVPLEKMPWREYRIG